MTSEERRLPSAERREEILTTFRTLLLGSKRGVFRQVLSIGLALGIFGITFLAYEFNLFYHSGGVVFIPFHAALVGVIAAFWIGYSRTGLLYGWGFTYLSFLGWRSEWATDISPRPLGERVAYILQPDGLVILAILGAGVTVVGFTAGALARKVIIALRTGLQTPVDS